MIINNELCKKCGRCITECANKAISKTDGGEYIIDQSVCTDCSHASDIECIRMCKFDAITKKDGTIPEIDRTARIIANHIPYLIAIMGDRGNSGRFPVDNKEWAAFRKMSAAAFTNPDMKIRIIIGNDDICVGCAKKQEGCWSGPQEEVFERLGIKPGAKMRFWDMIQLIEDKYSAEFVKKVDYNLDDEFIGWMRTFLSPDAKFFINKD